LNPLSNKTPAARRMACAFGRDGVEETGFGTRRGEFFWQRRLWRGSREGFRARTGRMRARLGADGRHLRSGRAETRAYGRRGLAVHPRGVPEITPRVCSFRGASAVSPRGEHRATEPGTHLHAGFNTGPLR
jgi:hypothetical protein